MYKPMQYDGTSHGPDPGREPDVPDAHLPATIAKNERTVKRSFWRKLTRVAGQIPFAEDAAAAYFCAVDRQTPARVRATLLAALAYFVVPTDLIPDFIAGIGFSDDATVLMTALGIIAAHLKPQHREQARKALRKQK